MHRHYNIIRILLSVKLCATPNQFLRIVIFFCTTISSCSVSGSAKSTAVARIPSEPRWLLLQHIPHRVQGNHEFNINKTLLFCCEESPRPITHQSFSNPEFILLGWLTLVFHYDFFPPLHLVNGKASTTIQTPPAFVSRDTCAMLA